MAYALLSHAASMSRARVTLGEIGENLACAELERRGYEVLARRYRCRAGEIDIVAKDGPCIVFVEVKTRHGTSFGRGVEAVTWTKRSRIIAVAADFLTRERLVDRPCRFDVVSITMGREGQSIEVFPHAFDVAQGRFRR